MGWFDSPEEEAQKARDKKIKDLIKKKGFVNILAEDADLTKVQLAQNQHMIALLTQLCLINGGLISDTIILTMNDMYYKSLENYINIE